MIMWKYDMILYEREMRICRKILMILVCGVLVLGMTGCNNSAKENNNDNNNYSEAIDEVRNTKFAILGEYTIG